MEYKNTPGLLIAAALFCAVTSVAFATKSARAADLGGDCCADLEERVAELEETTVRKGNKKVAVILYGQVNRAALFWNDGAKRIPTSSTIITNSSRFGIKGNAKTGIGDWVGGYRLEVEPTQANSAKLDQFDDNNSGDPMAISSSAIPSCI